MDLSWIDPIEVIAENSFRDFHVKGFDYLCLKRSPERTVKVYFMGSVDMAHPELVSPHDHRYDFKTTVLAGELVNWRYHPRDPEPLWRRTGKTQPYEMFDYLTPLNGGGGFEHVGLVNLYRHRPEHYQAGHWHTHRAHELHTIGVKRDTVLMLEQGPDVVALDKPTRTFFPAGMCQGPSLDGLYRKMDVDHALMLLGYTIRMLER